MELRQLRFAITLAAELHFGRAAEREHITEPALSQQIRQLEQEIGARLFDRSSRRVDLTQAGAVFVEHAQRVLAQADETVIATRQAGEGKVGHLRIGFPSATVPARVRTIMRTFRSRFPQVSRSITPRGDGRLLEELRHDRLDLAIVRTRTAAIADLRFMVICEEPLVLVLPRRHRLARARQIRPESLDGERLVLFPREQNPELYDYVLAFLGQVGIHVSLIDRYRSLENRYAVAKGRNAIALVPASTATQVRGLGTVTRRFARRAPLAEVSLVWHKRDTPPLVKTFINLTREISARV
jgi:DNA-binding transcriptional LysR family regulator